MKELSVVNRWIEHLDRAISANPEGGEGIFARARCALIPDGPNDHPAVLALTDANPDIPAYRYGVICWLNAPPAGYVAMLVRVSVSPDHTGTRETHHQRHQRLNPDLTVDGSVPATSLVTAADVQSVLEAFVSDVLTREDVAWHIAQDIADGTAECAALEDALSAFEHTIRRYRQGGTDTPLIHHGTTEILEFYGLSETDTSPRTVRPQPFSDAGHAAGVTTGCTTGRIA